MQPGIWIVCVKHQWAGGEEWNHITNDGYYHNVQDFDEAVRTYIAERRKREDGGPFSHVVTVWAGNPPVVVDANSF